jgi:hypothetical protein
MIVDRSLDIKVSSSALETTLERLLNILGHLAEKRILENSRKLIVGSDFSHNPRFIDVICSMKNLETLDLWNCKLKLEQLPCVFSSCQKLVKLVLRPLTCNNWGMDEDLKNELRPGFQRLQSFRFKCHIYNHMWPVIQEILT